jgi:uncharacterized protein (TIGR00255 family)
MTGFATGRGEGEGHEWTWELRSVNARGFDLRLRLPDWIEGLEPAVRARLSKSCARGAVTVSLRISAAAGAAAPALDPARLDAALGALAEVEARAREAGVDLAPANAAQVLALRGVMAEAAAAAAGPALRDALLADLEGVVESFLAMRAAEGRELEAVLRRELDEIGRLTEAAADAAEARREDSARALREALARVADAVEVDEARVAQELALLAVKADVTEELDRLRAHVAAARALLEEDAPAGRRLDFLTQEFNREANTLCSKSGHAELTRIGLDLKAVIDRMREQVQNVE